MYLLICIFIFQRTIGSNNSQQIFFCTKFKQKYNLSTGKNQS